MDESRRLAMRRGHLRNKGYCTCGKVVSGNGGYAAHKAMHQRRGEWRRDFTGAVVNKGDALIASLPPDLKKIVRDNWQYLLKVKAMSGGITEHHHA